MAHFGEHEFLCPLKSSRRFTLQLDEPTDVAGLAILIVLVRYVFNSSIQEDTLFCRGKAATSRIIAIAPHMEHFHCCLRRNSKKNVQNIKEY
ncbi:hypothetical protein CEXT_778701 [Caerostris extrusa]|uniref:Uncharacterized protein n=1 Tax=Caerostris extrusa TaxID=172846 RepID=A0AAV4XLU9_CAEEX|nr:hypothetical protein CEXT_778701 [Caerostris extrusa]